MSPVPSLRLLPPESRPRERMFAVGVESLSDTELIAAVLGSGSRRKDVLSTASDLLQRFGDLETLAQAPASLLLDGHGIGPARACILQAAFELGRRSVGSRPRQGRRLGHPAEVWSHLRARLAAKPVEEFWALALDVRHRLLFESCLARGSLTGVEVHPRDVFRPLIREGAAAVLFCHNHPSGDSSPSREDIELTARLREVGNLCGIQVLDHVVVARDGFVSLASRGWR